jgi:hypothetical protein
MIKTERFQFQFQFIYSKKCLLYTPKKQKQKENRKVNPDQPQHLRRDLLRHVKVGLGSQTSRRKDQDVMQVFEKYS